MKKNVRQKMDTLNETSPQKGKTKKKGNGTNKRGVINKTFEKEHKPKESR